MRTTIAIIWTTAILEIVSTEATVSVAKWSKHLQNFQSILGGSPLDTEKKRNTLESRRDEIHNFNGEPLRLTYYEDPGFFEFYDNDTKVTGICGDIWTTLSKFLNFTIVLEKIDRNPTMTNNVDKAITIIIKKLELNTTDIVPKILVSARLVGVVKFTPVLWLNRQRIFAHAHWRENRAWMFLTFSKEVWALIVIFVVTLSVASIVTQRMLIRERVPKLRNKSYFGHLFYTFAALCNQGNGPDNTESGSRILTFTINIFSWLILVAYSSCLINDMAQVVVDAPIKNLAALLEDTQLKILVPAGSLSHSIFFNNRVSGVLRRIVEEKRVVVETDMNELYRKVCSQPNDYVLYDEEDAVIIRDIPHCKLISVDVPPLPMPIASGMSGRVKNKRSLEIGIIKLHELGVISGIRNHYMTAKAEETKLKETTKIIINISRVSVIFAILGAGILSSIVICFLENIVNSVRHRNIMRNNSFEAVYKFEAVEKDNAIESKHFEFKKESLSTR